MTDKEFKKRLAQIPVAEPDEIDKEMIARIEEGEEMELAQFKKELDCSGKISLRLPKSLHKDLIISAKNEGVSLNQYLLYRLSN